MNELTNKVIKSIQHLLPEVEVDIQQISKNNDVIKTGVMLKSKDNNVAPVFYIDDMIADGWTADNIAIYICKYYREHDGGEYQYLTSLISDFEQISNMLTLQLVNRTLNASVLADLPFVPFLEDLAVIVLVDLEKDMRSCATVKVSHKMLELWDVTFEEVYHRAYLNLMKEEATVSSMTDILSELGYKETTELNVPMMYVLTNESRIHGATMMLRESFFKELTEKFNNDLVVIPSSVHELLLVPVNDSLLFNKDKFDQMVQEVNQTQVDPIEVLSDHIYLYRRDSGWYNFN